MSSLTWDEEDLWIWWVQVDDSQKRFMWKELISPGWLELLPATEQFKWFKHAPMEVLTILKRYPHIIKYETLLRLDAHVRGVPYKPKRGHRR